MSIVDCFNLAAKRYWHSRYSSLCNTISYNFRNRNHLHVAAYIIQACM